LPRTTVRSSFGATRTQQLSHQTLMSAFASAIFATFIVSSGFLWLTRHLSKTRDGRRRVIRLVFAFLHRAGQHQFSRRHRLPFFRSFALVKSEQNRRVALLAANAQIPSRVGFGPSRNIQRFHSRQKCPQLWLSQGGTGLTPLCFMIAIADYIRPAS
jgi:hypothetical protein